MPVNINAMKKARERVQSQQSGGRSWWKIPVGESLVYIADSPYKEDDLNFVELWVHNEIGEDNKMVICLDPEKNPVVQDPRIQKFLKDSGKDVSGGCRVCKAHDDGESLNKRQIGSSKFLWNLIPLKYRRKSGGDWGFAEEAESLLPLMCGPMLWEGIIDVYANDGDISNPDEAILVRVVRKGTGMTTKYDVSADTDSVRKGGIKLPKRVKAVLRQELQPNSSADLYKLVAGMMKSSSEVTSIYDGVEMEEEEEEKKPACFAFDFDGDDPDCKECEFLQDCEKESAPAKPSDEEGQDEEAEEDFIRIQVSDCEPGQWYCEDEGDGEFGPPMEFKEISKRGRGGKPKGVFSLDKKRITMSVEDFVVEAEVDETEPPPKPVLEEEDPELKALDEAIAKRKKRSKKR